MDEHLFRRAHAQIVATLARIFGVERLALAEDVAQDAIVRALEVWKVNGMPANPTAWLIATAKNRALDVLRKERTAERLAPEVERAFTDEAIRDDQLRMMFTCCHPSLAEEVQVALVLHILCGFGAPEIAGAFLATRAAIEKRLARGKQELATIDSLFELADAELPARLESVQRALYLLFSEGYHGTSAIRTDLCAEAIRLVALLCELPAAATPATHALAALMLLHAARLPARMDAEGELNAFADQDRARWDLRLVVEGIDQFEQATVGEAVSPYHIEAAIAVVHASAPGVEATNWAAICELYDQWMVVAPTPVVALNRAIAIGQRDGAAAGLAAVHAIEGVDRLASYPFYPAALGELELARDDRAAAHAHFTAALVLARNSAERRHLEKRLRFVETDVENPPAAPTHG